MTLGTGRSRDGRKEREGGREGGREVREKRRERLKGKQGKGERGGGDRKISNSLHTCKYTYVHVCNSCMHISLATGEAHPIRPTQLLNAHQFSNLGSSPYPTDSTLVCTLV